MGERADADEARTSLSVAVRASLPELVTAAVDAIWSQVPAYADSTDSELHANATEHVAAIFEVFLGVEAQQHQLAEHDRLRRDLIEDLLANRTTFAGQKRSILRAVSYRSRGEVSIMTITHAEGAGGAGGRPPAGHAATHLGEALGTDFFSVREQFTDEQWDKFATVRKFVDSEVVPVAGSYWERAEIAWDLVRRLPELGIVGGSIKGYGCAGMSAMANGLVNMELHRGDGSLAVVLGVHSGLAMQSIALCGSEEQKARWLPEMATMAKLGAFALTEPDHGSDSVALETSARPDGDGWILDGRKRWIGLGTVADLVVVWARSSVDGKVGAYVVERGTPGFEATVMEGKVSLRSVWQADIELTGVRVPGENRLPGARSFRDTTRVLAGTRSGCAWAALGHATAAYDVALRYVSERKQFGKPLASFQIIQQRLVSMLADLTAMQLYCLQIGRLADEGKLTPTVAGLAKMHNTRKARVLVAEARDMLGGNGILLENHVIRHMADLEAIHTFEGTETIQTLIVGRDITGIAAFA